MCTIEIEAPKSLDRTSRIKLYKNNTRSRAFYRIAKRSIILQQLVRFNLWTVFKMMKKGGRKPVGIDDYAKDGGEELFTMMHCVLIANP